MYETDMERTEEQIIKTKQKKNKKTQWIRFVLYISTLLNTHIHI